MHDVDARGRPTAAVAGSLTWRTLIGLAVDDDRVVGVADLARVGAVGRVVLEQQGVGRDVDEVVDGDHLDVGGALDERLEGLAADAAEAVDADANGHRRSSLDRDARTVERLDGDARRDGWRTAGRTRRCPRARTGRGDVGSAAAVAIVATAAATPKPGGVPMSAGRSGDRCSWRPVLARWWSSAEVGGGGRESGQGVTSERCGSRRSARILAKGRRTTPPTGGPDPAGRVRPVPEHH